MSNRKEFAARKGRLRAALCADPQLSRGAVALSVFILEHIFSPNGYCGETVETYKQAIGASSRSCIQRALNSLIACGYFTVYSRAGGRKVTNHIFMAPEKPEPPCAPLSLNQSFRASKPELPCGPGPGNYPCKVTQEEEEECVADTPHIPTALVDGKRFSAFRRTGLNDEEAEELFRRFSDRLNWTDCEWASAIRNPEACWREWCRRAASRKLALKGKLIGRRYHLNTHHKRQVLGKT